MIASSGGSARQSWIFNPPIALQRSYQTFKFDAKNPNADEQKFYELLTRFNPQKKEFQFQFLLDSCSELPPRIKKAQLNGKKNKPQPNGKKNKPQPNLKKKKKISKPKLVKSQQKLVKV